MNAINASEGWTGQTVLLLRLDAQRVGESLRHPTGSWIGVSIPLLFLVGLLWQGGAAAAPDVQTVQGAVTLGLLLSGALSFLVYGTLFRGGDDPFLRRLGIVPRALFWARALRLLGVGLGMVLLVLLPFLSAGLPLRRPLVLALAAVLTAWGSGLAALALAARAVSDHRTGQRFGLLSYGMWDPSLASVAPLVYAPLLPLCIGAPATGFVGADSGAAWDRLLLVGIAALLMAWLGARWHTRALPRFAPRALEMTFVAPPSDAGELVVGRGASRLLPRRAAAVWARDAVVASRRFAWAGRLSWPVGIAAVAGLARWGQEPSTRVWIALVVLVALVVQGGAVVRLGRLEQGGRRWIDRALGIGWRDRVLGRWAWSVGLSFWLTIPVALAWDWWSGAGSGWPWIFAGVAVAGVSTVASLISAGWR